MSTMGTARKLDPELSAIDVGRQAFDPGVGEMVTATPSYKPWLNEEDPDNIFSVLFMATENATLARVGSTLVVAKLPFDR